MPSEPPPAADTRFDAAKRLFVEGLAHFEARRLDAAERCFEASLAQVTGRVSTLVNLAATKLQLGRADEALAIADALLEREPDNADAWLHRGDALAALGRHDAALAAFDALLALQPRLAAGWVRRGQALQALNRPQPALAAYDRALAIDANLALAWSNRGGILREALRLDEAAAAFTRAIAYGADPQLTGYYLAAVGAGAAPAGAPAHYVRTLFDDYAAEFDAHLVGVLGYCGHRVLVDRLERLWPGRRYRSALDLGCGTGLCGPLLRPHVERLAGVDLSAGMLARARLLGVYDTLEQADIVAALRDGAAGEENAAGHQDLIVAADVFIYVGELAPVFAAAHSALDAGGVFCFSAEAAHADNVDHELLASLRYAHSPRYLAALAAQHGFEVVEIVARPIRSDQRSGVDALFVQLQRR